MIAVVCLAFLLAVLQGGLARVSSGTFVPDLALLFAVMFVLFGGFAETLVFAFVAGLLLDFSSGLTDGVILSGFVLALLAVYTMFTMVLTREFDFKILFFAVIAAMILFPIFVFLFSLFLSFLHLSSRVSFGVAFGWSFWKKLIFDLLLVYPVFWVFNLFDRKISKPQEHKIL